MGSEVKSVWVGGVDFCDVFVCINGLDVDLEGLYIFVYKEVIYNNYEFCCKCWLLLYCEEIEKFWCGLE